MYGDLEDRTGDPPSSLVISSLACLRDRLTVDGSGLAEALRCFSSALLGVWEDGLWLRRT